VGRGATWAARKAAKSEVQVRCHFLNARHLLFAALSAVLVLTVLASAKDAKKQKTTTSSSTVVLAHVDLRGRYDAMALRQVQERRYLYVRQKETADWQLFDLSDPSRPVELSGVSLPGLVAFDQISMQNDAVIATGQASFSDAATRLAVGDLDSPLVQTFDGVRKIIFDRPSDLIYVLSDDGLRILRVQPQVTEPDPSLYGG
jgi:hypothetical protein